MTRPVLRELIPRTIVALSFATALVALALAFDLANRGAGLEDSHGPAHGTGSATHAPVTSEAGFLAAMIPHHQEAVDVAREVRDLGQRPEVRALAAEIVATQAEEVAQLRAWLAAWHPDEPPAPYVPMMRRLEGLTPPAVDVVFVFDMISHHEVAVAMAEEALALRPAPRAEVAELARAIARVQGEEIARLQAWIDAWWPEGAAGTHPDH